jgi:hypothetical protein
VIVEDADDLLELVLGEPRIDRGRLDVLVPQVFLHGAEIASG